MTPRVTAVPKPALLFLHIPKTGGITLRQVVERQYPRARTHLVGDPYWAFWDMPEHLRARLRLVEGHMPLGLHAALPQPSTYVTMLREPLERVVSDYYYLLRTPTAKFHDEVTSRRMSLADLVRSGISVEFDNEQTRLLGDDPWVEFGACSTEMVDAAKRNLRERFAAVGLVERFDLSLLVMARALGWRRPLYYVRRNVTRDRPRVGDLDVETRRLLEETHRFDRELYSFARALFDEHVQRLFGGPGRAAEAEERFRQRNRVLGPAFGAGAVLGEAARGAMGAIRMRTSRSGPPDRPA
jgi:hypothetical protein